jgi:hypothetical protein
MMTGRQRACILIAALILAETLAGCAGGPIARQIASSIASQTADKIVSDYVDEQLLKDPEPQSLVLQTSEPDADQIAFLMAELPTITPAPPSIPAQKTPASPAIPAAPIISRLVSVEVWALIVGEEKQAALSLLREQGAALIPKEWEGWQLAEGGVRGKRENTVLFLVPPELGKIKSGDHAVVEIPAKGALNVARHLLN